eukprot:Platyproteum_vivax@DN4090_c0_g1_i1.p1
MEDFESMGESAEQLEQKLLEYKQQLQQVEEALYQQPEEEMLLRLRSDLQELIKITEEFCASEGKAPKKEFTEAEPEFAAAPPVVTSQMAPRLTPASAETQALVGRTCEALYNQKWCTAIIIMVRKASTGHDKCVVQYVGYKTKHEFRVQDVSLIQPPHPAQCQPGTLVQAIWKETGEWYDAHIEQQTEAGYSVTFSNQVKAEINFDQVRLKKTKGGPASDANNKRKIAEIVTPGGWKIPENLSIKPGDSEAEKKLKRKKIHAIKSRQRQEQTEMAAEEKKSGWQRFQKRAATKTTGQLMKKESIFKSPDSISGKVGVTGSGKEMTEFYQRDRMSIHYMLHGPQNEE